MPSTSNNTVAYTIIVEFLDTLMYMKVIDIYTNYSITSIDIEDFIMRRSYAF